MDALRLPNLRLPQTDRPNTWSVLGSVVFHAFLIGLVVWAQTKPEDEAEARGPGAPGAPGGGGGMRFITLEALPPAAAVRPNVQPDVAPPPVIVPPPVTITLPTPKLDVPLPTQVLVATSGTVAGGGPGAGRGAGGGQGPGLGRDTGVGTGGEGGDTFPPTVKFTILPPLPAPASVKGRALRVHFWVDTEGRVTRVRVEPEIRDAGYRAKFYALMREYVFEPAHTLDGTKVAARTHIDITP